MAKKHKVDVGARSDTPDLVHNPFGALAGASAPQQATTAPAAPETARETKPRGRLILRRETKHRGGKAVVVVSGFETRPDLDEAARLELLQHLKQQLGCGGTLQTKRDVHELLVQGDQPGRVAELLRARGFRVEGVTS